MDAGALGWSAQRTGAHSIQADYDGTPMVTDTMSEDDLLAFARALGRRGEGFIQLTNATGDLQKDLKLCEDVALAAGRPVLFNVVLAVTELPWVHKMFVDWLASCHARGIPMFGQANSIRAPFRFTLEDWNLFDSSPAWNKALTGTHDEKKRKLADPELVRAMAAESDAGMLQTPILGGPIAGHVFEGAKNAPELDRYIGQSVGEIAGALGVHPVEAMVQLSLASDLSAGFLTKSATSDNAEFVGELLASPYAIPGVSDGGAHTKFLTSGSYTTDTLAWLVRDTKRMTLEDAHYKLSYLPGARGRLPRPRLARRGLARRRRRLRPRAAEAPARLVGLRSRARLPGRRVAAHPARRGLPLDDRERRDHVREREVHRGGAGEATSPRPGLAPRRRTTGRRRARRTCRRALARRARSGSRRAGRAVRRGGSAREAAAARRASPPFRARPRAAIGSHARGSSSARGDDSTPSSA